MADNLDYGKAILEINPEAHFSISGNDYSTIEWVDDTTPISEADIKAKAEEIVKRDAHISPRVLAYPSITEQLDDIYHNGIDGWKATIKAVKDKYPKE